MFRNHELDSLKPREQDAFQRKQTAWKAYADARDRCNVAHETMESAWQERRLAGENSSREWEALQDAKHNHQEVWDEYGRIRDYNNPRIESLRYQADHEHQEMQNAFDRASSEYEYGDKSMAPVYAQEGRAHKERRDELNSEISKLCAEVREARQNAEWRAPSSSSAAFHLAKEAFDRAKAHHETAQAEFKRLKVERDRLKAEFDSAQAEHLQLKEEFQGKLEEIKTNNKRERDRILDKAGVRWSERNDAKIVKKSDGTTQIYHGGFGKGDGYGHGHTALDSSGHKTYDRDAFAEHGQQNFTESSDGVTMFDRRARSDHEVKGVEGYVQLHPNVKGHGTQYYNDGFRVSRDTSDGVHEENVHWTNQNLRKKHPHRHTPPDDTN